MTRTRYHLIAFIFQLGSAAFDHLCDLINSDIALWPVEHNITVKVKPGPAAFINGLHGLRGHI